MPKIPAKGLHPRNLHNDRYDFESLIQCEPKLAPYVSRNQYGDYSIDFANPKAVFALNKALLCSFYQITHYELPKDSLCPPIPGRADYVHYLADLLARSNSGEIPTGPQIRVLDIGIGANCIYPIVGHRIYGWSFIGSDIDPAAITSADHLIASNSTLQGGISTRLQKNSDLIFQNIIREDERFDLTLCNPPFHKSQADAAKGTSRKNRNLGHKKSEKNILNFAGKANELWYPGGEIAFVTKMIKESVLYAQNCLWFSTLVSKKENLPVIYKVLQEMGVIDVQTLEMTQGQKVTRIVAWTFLTPEAQILWSKSR